MKTWLIYNFSHLPLSSYSLICMWLLLQLILLLLFFRSAFAGDSRVTGERDTVLADKEKTDYF